MFTIIKKKRYKQALEDFENKPPCSSPFELHAIVGALLLFAENLF